jgi:hypothetical protein
MYDDPYSRLVSNRSEQQRLYRKLLKDGQYEELLRDYLSSRCAASDVWKAFEMLLVHSSRKSRKR